MINTRMRSLCLVALMAAIPFGHMLELGYRIGDPEPWIITLLFALLGMGLAWLTAARRSYAAVYALALYWFLDANVYDSGWLLAIPLLAVILAFGFFMRRIEDWALPAASIFAVMFSLTAMINPHSEELVWAQPAPAEATGGMQPAVLHLVLDEFMSPLAMPETLPETHPAAKFLADLADAGFAVTTRAVSISDKTRVSVSAIMGLTDADDNFTENPRGSDFSYSVKNNRLFTDLAAKGYAVTAIQANFLELCSPEVAARCGTYTRGVSMDAVARLGLPLTRRIQLALLALYQDYLNQKGLHQVALLDLAANVAAGRDASFGFFSRPVVMVDVLDQIASGKLGPAPGEALVAHLLAPHFPYVLNPDCTLKAVADWTLPLHSDDSQEPAAVYRGFWDQAACTLGKVKIIVDRLAAQGNVIVVIHGDHGSRITSDTEDENPDDVLMTFVATKAPGLSGGLDDQVQILQTVVADFYQQVLHR